MKPMSMLNGHPNRNYCAGVEPIPARSAMACRSPSAWRSPDRSTARTYRVFVVTGDGELQEGSNWEAAMAAGYRKLGNLALIVDRNTLQQGARVAETNEHRAAWRQIRAFGWEVTTSDGHDRRR